MCCTYKQIVRILRQNNFVPQNARSKRKCDFKFPFLVMDINGIYMPHLSHRIGDEKTKMNCTYKGPGIIE